MRRVFAALVAAMLAGPAAADCRQALVLGLDVSGSVDAAEYALQLNGLATALEAPAVQEALFAFPDAPVSLAVFEWSSGSYQRLILGWTAVEDSAALSAITARLRGWRREEAPQSTGIGAALNFASALIRQGPVCWKTTVDVSGDGKNNDWPEPRDVVRSGLFDGMTVNALVVGQETTRRGQGLAEGAQALSDWFRAHVIHGPDAFVETATGYEDYARAMERKLLRELSSLPMGKGESGGSARFAQAASAQARGR